MFIKRVENGVRAKSKVIYKYTGLLKCGECGKNLVTIGSVSKSGRKLFYVCTTYNKYGKEYCSRHILSHDDVDSIIFEQLEALYKSGLLKMDNLDKSLEQRPQSNKDNGKVIDRLQTAIHAKKADYYGNPGVVTSLVRRLRKKIEPDCSNPYYIRTIQGVGYKLGVKPYLT